MPEGPKPELETPLGNVVDNKTCSLKIYIEIIYINNPHVELTVAFIPLSADFVSDKYNKSKP